MDSKFHSTLLLGKLQQAVCQETDRSYRGVSYLGISALILGDRLQRSSRRITLTYMYPQWKPPRAPPSSSMRTYPKWYPSTSQVIM